MASKAITGKDLRQIGFSEGFVITNIMRVIQTHYKTKSKNYKIGLMRQVFNNPAKFAEHKQLGIIVKSMEELENKRNPQKLENVKKGEYKVYGRSVIDEKAIHQMEQAMKLPVSVAGALMPDAHVGYGLPIGGVLATENVVIPYGVGVDIGCRMCLSLFDRPASDLINDSYNFKTILKENTKFGNKEVFNRPSVFPVLEHSAFKEIPIMKKHHNKAYRQLGTSGGGNHFAEFGEINITDENNEWNLPIGVYLGLLTHSGSRGMGAEIALHYTRIAKMNSRLPIENRNMAWLDLSSEAGQMYWLAMNVAGDYASACHHDIHNRISKAIGANVVVRVENHHNFAWKEKQADGRELIVHRKGATPAKKGELGIIPGSMLHAGYIVRGLGNVDSLNSASHGAGRVYSRKKAKASFSKKDIRKQLQKNGITLIGGGVDEAPMAYKNIDAVMKYQNNLVEVVGKFQPRIVRMAKDG